MANICLDVMPLTHVVNGTGWYEGLRRDIEGRKVLLCIAGGQYKKEIQGNNKIKSWINRLSEAGKARSIDLTKFAAAVREMRDHELCKCKECDDPHLFSICMVGEAEFLFTEDKRISKCRTKMKKSKSLQKFCKIKLIYRHEQYKSNRSKIFS